MFAIGYAIYIAYDKHKVSCFNFGYFYGQTERERERERKREKGKREIKRKRETVIYMNSFFVCLSFVNENKNKI